MTKILTKEEIVERLKNISRQGWIKNARPGNVGGVGNTLEDLLGIEENNLPIPNASEWELKCQRLNSSSLTTLFHLEPSPQALKFVPRVFLLKYGWPHKFAGVKHPDNEMSFRQTIHGFARSERGFMVKVDRSERKVLVSFDSKFVDTKHAAWLDSVHKRIGLGELDPQPYWGFDDLYHNAGRKLLNCFYVGAKVKREINEEFFMYEKILMLHKFSWDKFLTALEKASVLIDFDARTGHNHGTKFRLRQNQIVNLYEHVTVVS